MKKNDIKNKLYSTRRTIPNSTLSGVALKILTAYLTILFVFSLGERFFFTKTIWDNVIGEALRILPGEPKLHDVIYLLGIPMLVYILLMHKERMLKRDSIVFGLFTLILIGTAILNPDVNCKQNLLQTFHVIEPILICYYSSCLLDENGWNFLLKKALFISICLWGIGCAVSFIYYLLDYQGSYHFGNVPATNPQGVIGGRLYGAFSDLNYASVVCVILIIGGLFLIKRHLLNRIEKTITYCCIVLFVIYTALAYSRTAIVAIWAILFMLCLYSSIELRKKSYSILRIVLKFAIKLILSTILLILAYIVINLVCMGIGLLIVPDRNSLEILRPAMLDGDVSGGRFQIWYEYLKALIDYPLFGFSADGSFDYVCRYYPDTLVASWGFFHHHNTYVQVLCQGGIVGFIIIYLNVAAPNIKYLIHVFRNSARSIPTHVNLFFLWSLICLTAGMFYSMGFTQIRFEGDILWLALGGLNSYMDTPS